MYNRDAEAVLMTADLFVFGLSTCRSGLILQDMHIVFAFCLLHDSHFLFSSISKNSGFAPWTLLAGRLFSFPFFLAGTRSAL